MNLKNFELIIFDLDGTLVNSAKDIMIANNKTLVKFGYKPISFKNVKDIIGQGIRVNIIRSLKMQKIKISKKKENEMHDYFFSFYKKNLFIESKVYVGLKSFLKKLDKKNYKLAVCSNKLEELTKIVLKKTKLSKYFDFVAGGDTFTHRKPHPSVLNNVVKKFKINKKKALFIGDSEHDYHSAKNSNIKFCLKTKGFTNKPVSYFNKSLKIKAYTDKIIF
jgi:phosphoglycolate phosphatase